VPLTRLVTEQARPVDVVVQVRPPGDAVTRYPVIVSPPVDVGGAHVIRADLADGVARTNVGLLGTSMPVPENAIVVAPDPAFGVIE